MPKYILIRKYNPYHDELGKFSSSNAAHADAVRAITKHILGFKGTVIATAKHTKVFWDKSGENIKPTKAELQGLVDELNKQGLSASLHYGHIKVDNTVPIPELKLYSGINGPMTEQQAQAYFDKGLLSNEDLINGLPVSEVGGSDTPILTFKGNPVNVGDAFSVAGNTYTIASINADGSYKTIDSFGEQNLNSTPPDSNFENFTHSQPMDGAPVPQVSTTQTSAEVLKTPLGEQTPSKIGSDGSVSTTAAAIGGVYTNSSGDKYQITDIKNGNPVVTMLMSDGSFSSNSYNQEHSSMMIVGYTYSPPGSASAESTSSAAPASEPVSINADQAQSFAAGYSSPAELADYVGAKTQEDLLNALKTNYIQGDISGAEYAKASAYVQSSGLPHAEMPEAQTTNADSGPGAQFKAVTGIITFPAGKWDAQREYGTSINQAWVQGLTSDQRASIKTLTGSSYGSINPELRNNQGIPDANSYNNNTIKNITDALSTAVMPEAVTVFRKFDADASFFAYDQYKEAERGWRFIDPAFNSTSLDPKMWSGNIVLQIEIPAGYRGAQFIGDISSHPDEQEVLMQRGTRYEVIENLRHDDATGKLFLRVRPIGYYAPTAGTVSQTSNS